MCRWGLILLVSYRNCHWTSVMVYDVDFFFFVLLLSSVEWTRWQVLINKLGCLTADLQKEHFCIDLHGCLVHLRDRSDLVSEMSGVFGADCSVWHSSFRSQSSLSQGQTGQHALILQQDLIIHKSVWASQHRVLTSWTVQMGYTWVRSCELNIPRVRWRGAWRRCLVHTKVTALGSLKARIFSSLEALA